MITEAAFYEQSEDSKVICHLCPAECLLALDKVGICNCRFNKNGKLMTDNYAEVVALAVDPIEKKPLYHYYPSQNILSIGANGCNFGCLNCQNWEISQENVTTKTVLPEQLVSLAKEHNSIGVAFTYTEPFIWYEYIYESAQLLKKNNLSVVLVSNGYINQKPLKKLLPFIDAINIDLKSMDSNFYKKICKGKLQPVLDTIVTIANSDTHLELTNLVIPGYNDSEDQIEKLVDFVASLSEYIPMHFSAYHPDYKMTAPATSEEMLYKAAEIARKKMKYVFVGNIGCHRYTDSHCPNCSNLLIRRLGYKTEVVGLDVSHCTQCGFDTKIIQG